MLPFTKEEFDEFKKYLEDNKIPYIIENGGSTNIIRSKIGDAKVVNGKLPPKDLGFINRIRNQIQRNLKGKKNFWRNKNIINGKKIIIEFSSDGKPNIAYSRWANQLKVGKSFNDIYEVDIRGAYWSVVNRWGLLSKELYLEGKTKKKLRLIALGSLAKKKYLYKYVPKTGHQIPKGTKVNRRTKKVWDNTCALVGESILDVQKNLPPSDFIFFWVDGIYFKGKHNVEKVLEVFLKHGFKCKVRKIFKVRVEIDKKYKSNANTIVVYENKKQFKEKEGRPFFLHKEAFN